MTVIAGSGPGCQGPRDDDLPGLMLRWKEPGSVLD